MKIQVAIVLALCAAVAGCSDSNVSQGAPHAHGKVWVTTGPVFHGIEFRDGTIDCRKCHEIDSYCLKCHFDPTQDDVRVPPGSNWQHGSIPHHFLAFERICNTCHAALRQYGQGPQPCHDCHGKPAVPHPLNKDWFIPNGGAFHGTTTVPDCSACHSPLGDFCTTCHFTNAGSRVPPGADWTHALASHAGTDANLAPSQDVCVNCHEIESGFTGQPTRTGSDCTHCHGFAMHAMPYVTDHQSAARANLLPCRQCHDTPAAVPNFDGYVSGTACATCHPDAKAHPFPWYEGHRSVGSNWPTVCAICHNTQSATPATGPFPGAPTCFSTSFNSKGCHAGGPGTAPHALGQAWLDPTRTTTFHGTHLDLFPCQDCHDTNTFCSTCHFGPGGSKVPPSVSWTHGRYPHDLTALVSQQAVCNQCHTLMKGFTGGPTRTDCANCHGIAQPHGASFLTAHQTQPGMDLAVCQRCHGQPGAPLFSGGVVPQPVCTTCHAAARAHPAPWRLAAGAGVSHRNAGNIPTACAICHDTVIGGDGTTPLPGATPCRDCHSAGFVTHGTGRLWLDKKVNGFHGEAANADVTSCQPCHGADYRGGISGVSCYTCHFGPQGWQSPTGLAHVGTSPRTHSTFASSASVCNACHNTNRTYGNASPSVNCTLACHDD